MALCIRSAGMSLCIPSAGLALGNQSAGMALCTLQSATPANCTKWVKIANFDQERVFRFGPLCQWSQKFPSRIFYLFWVPTSKITNGSFWPSCDQMMLLTGVRSKPGFGLFDVRPWVKFSKFWPGKTSDLYANGPESFPQKFFTTFGGPMAEIYESVFLTVVRPNGAFDWRATKIYVGSFWSLCDQEGLQKSATNGGLKENPSIVLRLHEKLLQIAWKFQTCLSAQIILTTLCVFWHPLRSHSNHFHWKTGVCLYGQICQNSSEHIFVRTRIPST